MTTRVIHLTIPLNLTDDLPALEAGVSLVKPVATSFAEPLEINYSGEDLLALIKKHNVDLVGGVKLNPGVLNNLPIEYLYELYMHIRYGLDPSPAVYPVKAGVTYSTGYLALKQYPLLSLIFTSLYLEKRDTIDPVLQYEGEQMLRHLKHINYAWLEAANRHIANPAEVNYVVCSKATHTKIFGTTTETVDVYYLNNATAAPLLTGGSTVDDLVDYYISTGLQPSA